MNNILITNITIIFNLITKGQPWYKVWANTLLWLSAISASAPVSWVPQRSPAGDRDPLTPEAVAYPVPVRFALRAFQSRGWF